MTDFKNGQELLEVCKKKQCSISEVMKQREIEGTSSTKKEVEDKMQKSPRHHERGSKKAIGRPETVHERTDRRGGKADYRIQRERDKCLRNVYEQTDRLQHGGSGSQRFDGSHRCGTDCRIFRCGSGSVTGTAGGKRIQRRTDDGCIVSYSGHRLSADAGMPLWQVRRQAVRQR